MTQPETELPEIELLETDANRLRAQLQENENNPRTLHILPPGSKHFPRGIVMRYAVRYDDEKEHYGCAYANPRNRNDNSLAVAQEKLAGLLRENTPDRLAVFGGAKALFVAFMACYPGHFDLAPIDLGSTPRFPADIFHMPTLRRLGEHILRARRDFPLE